MAKGKLSSQNEIIDALKRKCVDSIILEDHVNQIFEDAKKELVKVLASKRFKNFLTALMYAEIKEQLIETRLLDLLSKRDKDYIITKAVKKVLRIKDEAKSA